MIVVLFPLYALEIELILIKMNHRLTTDITCIVKYRKKKYTHLKIRFTSALSDLAK